MESSLRRSVLVLNRFWQPVQTCSARRALKLLCLGHVQVLQTDGEAKFQTHDFDSWLEYSGSGEVDELVHSVRIALGVPRIVVLTFFDRYPRLEVRLTRRNVFLRDGFVCQYCSKQFPETELNLDHVVPRHRGGRMSWENIVTSCVRCNTRKGHKLPKEANMHPLRSPVTPRWRPVFGLRGYQGPPHESWRHFLEPDRGAVRLSA